MYVNKSGNIMEHVQKPSVLELVLHLFIVLSERHRSTFCINSWVVSWSAGVASFPGSPLVAPHGVREEPGNEATAEY